MADARPCPECGRPLPPGAPAGACPACLMRKGLGPPSGTPCPDETAAFDVSYGLEPTDVGHVLETLSRSIGPIHRVLLPDTDPDDRGQPVIQPSSPEMPSPSARGDRYLLFGEIARGGMGAVLRGRDADLGRDLAVKVLLEGHQEKPELIRRFVEEAQIGGQLQHPGIVPVYELGTFADLRPYFTMKLVKGRTLAALLHERSVSLLPPGEGARRADAGAAPDATTRSSPWLAELPRFLSIFEAVCQTVAYAHARGVIHRDLKPSNVMVGSFGEVQVMDWGLAKILREGGVQDEPPAGPGPDASVIATVRSGSDVDDSQAGSLMGTPAYMAPEQAAGQVELTDRRADVFGLGSILCEILTGRPAFTGRTQAEVVRKALRGDLAEALAALDACGAEPELASLARDCLSAEPQDRPRDAGAVAARVTAHLAGVQERLRTAERERAVAEARAVEERRRRKLQLGLAASLLALTTAGGLGTTYYLQQRQARAAAVEQVLSRATLLRDQAREHADDLSRWQVALAAIDQAEAVLGGETLARGRLASLRDEVQASAHAAEVDRKLLDRLVDIRSAKADDPDGSATEAQYADEFRGAGLDFATLAPAEAAARIKARPPAIATAMISALDDWAAVRREVRTDKVGAQRLSEVARGADLDAWRHGLRDALDQPDRAARLAALKDLATKAKIDELGPVSVVLLGLALAVARDLTTAEALLRPAQRQYPEDVWVNYNLAGVLESLGRTDEAVRYFTAARALRPELAHELAHALERKGEHDEAIEVFRQLCRIRPGDGRHLGCFGKSLKARGRSEEAGKVLETALTALREEIRRHPDQFGAHTSLGLALEELGRYGEAIEEYRLAVKLQPEAAGTHFNLAKALSEQGRHDEAIAEFRAAIKLNPDDPVAHGSLGQLLSLQGRRDEAIPEFQTAIKLDPNDALAHAGLGQLLFLVGRRDEAIAQLRRAIELKPDFAEAHANLGGALAERGRRDEAIEEYRAAIKLKPGLAEPHANLANLLFSQSRRDEAIEEYRTVVKLKPDDALAHGSLGDALAEQGRRDEAIAEFRLAIRLKPDYAEAHADLGNVLLSQDKLGEAIAEFRLAIGLQPELAEAHANLGGALAGQGRRDEAIAELRLAIKLNPELAKAHAMLGNVLAEQGKHDEAITECQIAVRLMPELAVAHYNLGGVLADRGNRDEAIAELRLAIKLMPELAVAHTMLGNVLLSQDKLGEAIAEYRLAIGINPDEAEAHCNLGLVLQRRGDHAGAVQELRKGHDLGSRRPDWPHPSARWLAEAESMQAIAERLPGILRGGDKPANAAEGLVAAQLCYTLGLHAASVRLLKEALAMDPKLAADRQSQPRYNAACSAALAGCGKTKDDPPPDEAARKQLRDQGREWLAAELGEWTRFLQSGDPQARPVVVQALQHWKQDADLSGIREQDDLGKLPADEQKAWRALWADVDNLLKKASE